MAGKAIWNGSSQYDHKSIEKIYSIWRVPVNKNSSPDLWIIKANKSTGIYTIRTEGRNNMGLLWGMVNGQRRCGLQGDREQGTMR